MSSLGRWLIRIAASVAIAAASSFTTWLWIAMSPDGMRPPSNLTAGLEGSWDAISDQLDNRVKNRFPAGSREDAMAVELKREGFSRWDWTSSPDQEHEARRDESRFPCNIYAHIYWRADAEGHLTSIRGDIPFGTCL